MAEVQGEARAGAASWHEHNVTKPIDDPALCTGCGGEYRFDTTLPSVTWNRVIRAQGLPEFLCTACIVRAFVLAGEGFTAQLWSQEFNGVPVEFSIHSKTADSHAEMSEENTRLRAELFAYSQRESQWNESKLMQSNQAWFDEAKKVNARVVELEAELEKTRGLWYGACAARTEIRMELAELRRQITARPLSRWEQIIEYLKALYR